MAKATNCSVPDCTFTVKCRGLCNTHYERARKGKPLDGSIRRYTQQDMELLATGLRYCGACDTTKPLDQFGRRSICTDCGREQRRAWRAANPEMWHRQGKR